MKLGDVLVGVLIGGLAAHLWHYKDWAKKSSNKLMTDSELKEVIADATNVESSKYTNAFLKDFEVVLPPVQASKAVKEKAMESQKRRSRINPDKIQTPLYADAI
jgi:hypothetical protein